MNGNDELGLLGYTSSAPDFDLTEKTEVKSEDIDDLTTLQNVKRLITEHKKKYSLITSLSLEDKNFTIEQQLAINREVVSHLQEIEGLVDGVIIKAKETLKYGQR